MVDIPISDSKLKAMSYSDLVWSTSLIKRELDRRDKKSNDLMAKLKEYNYLSSDE